MVVLLAKNLKSGRKKRRRYKHHPPPQQNRKKVCSYKGHISPIFSASTHWWPNHNNGLLGWAKGRPTPQQPLFMSGQLTNAQDMNRAIKSSLLQETLRPSRCWKKVFPPLLLLHTLMANSITHESLSAIISFAAIFEETDEEPATLLRPHCHHHALGPILFIVPELWYMSPVICEWLLSLSYHKMTSNPNSLPKKSFAHCESFGVLSS